MAEKDKNKKVFDGKGDITGIALFALGVLTFLWLYWEPSQGVLGRYVTGTLLYLFGWVSVVFSVILALSGALLVARVIVPGLWRKLAGIFIIVCAVCSFAVLSRPTSEVWPAGLTGNILAAALKGLFGGAGAYIVTAVFLTAGIIFTFEIGVSALLNYAAFPFIKVFSAVSALAGSIKKRFTSARAKVRKKPPAEAPIIKKRPPERTENSEAGIVKLSVAESAPRRAESAPRRAVTETRDALFVVSAQTAISGLETSFILPTRTHLPFSIAATGEPVSKFLFLMRSRPEFSPRAP